MAKKLRMGIIGTGGIAGAHMGGYKAAIDEGLCDVVACCDVKKETVERFADTHGIPNAYTKFQDMLKKEKLDGVSVCTPNFMHCKPTVAALKAGVHVLCEKPLAMDDKESKLMVDTAKKARRQLQVGHHMRFEGNNIALKKLIADGELGNIYYARVQALRRAGIPSWGVFGVKKLQGGGPLIDIGVHILDLTMFLMDFPKPVAVSGMIYQKHGRNPKRYNGMGPWNTKTFTVEDFASAYVRFEGDLTMSIESSFLADIEKDEFKTTLVGDKGGLCTDPPALFRQESGSLTNTTLAGVTRTRGGHVEEVVSFVKAILNKKPVAVPGWQGHMVMQILTGIYKSAELGKEVRIK